MRWPLDSLGLEILEDCPGDEFTIDSGMPGSKARHSTLKACATSPVEPDLARTIRKFCLGQLARFSGWDQFRHVAIHPTICCTLRNTNVP